MTWRLRPLDRAQSERNTGHGYRLALRNSFAAVSGRLAERCRHLLRLALQQKWAKRKVAERQLPASLAGALPIVTFEMRGDAYSAEWSMYFPPSDCLLNPEFYPARVPNLMARYSEFFKSKVISNPFAWEHIAAWIAGDSFRPSLARLFGRRWPTLFVPQVIRSSFSFPGRVEASLWTMSSTTHATSLCTMLLPMLRLIIRAAQSNLSSRPGLRVLCYVSAQNSHANTLSSLSFGCAERGASIVQYDQNHGGSALVCYSRGHNHPPGYGRWTVDDTERIFREIRDRGKQKNPEFARVLHSLLRHVHGYALRPFRHWS